jgi:hypothetical protein
MRCKREDVSATNQKELDALKGETITYSAVNEHGLTDTEINASGAPDLLILKVQYGRGPPPSCLVLITLGIVRR